MKTKANLKDICPTFTSTYIRVHHGLTVEELPSRACMCVQTFSDGNQPPTFLANRVNSSHKRKQSSPRILEGKFDKKHYFICIS